MAAVAITITAAARNIRIGWYIHKRYRKNASTKTAAGIVLTTRYQDHAVPVPRLPASRMKLLGQVIIRDLPERGNASMTIARFGEILLGDTGRINSCE